MNANRLNVFHTQVVCKETNELLRHQLDKTLSNSPISVNSSPSFFDQVTCVHHFFTRSVVCGHRNFDEALCSPTDVYLYTGRGPSTSSMQLGHLVPFILTKYLHESIFPDSPLVIQLSDDEKYLTNSMNIEAIADFTQSNIKDIIAMGFKRNRTFAFSNLNYVHRLYPTVLRIQKSLTCNAIKNTFALKESDCVGKFTFPAMQAAPCFSDCFTRIFPPRNNTWRALVPCALDQDPFFLLTRHVAKKFKKPKPCVLHCDFVPSLKNPAVKMSSSKPENGVIYLSDTRDTIKKKIKAAFSGGRKTLEDFHSQGADLSKDVPYRLLKFFLSDQEEYHAIGHKYSKALLSSLAIKAYAAEKIIEITEDWRERRSSLGKRDVEEFLAERVLK